MPATQPMPSSLASAGTPPLHRGSPYSRSLPESSQSSTLYHYGSSPQAALRLSSASVTSPVRIGALTHALQISIKRLLGAWRCCESCALVLPDWLPEKATGLHCSCCGFIHSEIFILVP